MVCDMRQSVDNSFVTADCDVCWILDYYSKLLHVHLKFASKINGRRPQSIFDFYVKHKKATDCISNERSEHDCDAVLLTQEHWRSQEFRLGNVDQSLKSTKMLYYFNCFARRLP